jgi:hypothetical protein
MTSIVTAAGLNFAFAAASAASAASWSASAA